MLTCQLKVVVFFTLSVSKFKIEIKKSNFIKQTAAHESTCTAQYLLNLNGQTLRFHLQTDTLTLEIKGFTTLSFRYGFVSFYRHRNNCQCINFVAGTLLNSDETKELTEPEVDINYCCTKITNSVERFSIECRRT